MSALLLIVETMLGEPHHEGYAMTYSAIHKPRLSFLECFHNSDEQNLLHEYWKASYCCPSQATDLDELPITEYASLRPTVG